MNLQDMVDRHDYAAVAAALVANERRRGIYDFEALRTEPADEIESRGEVRVRVDVLHEDGCPVAGYYDHRATKIVLHPSHTDTRDRFTVLHEFGHHVQRNSADWADVWCMLPEADGDRLNEAVADAFAAEILLPPNVVNLAPVDVTARRLAQVHLQATASRSALAYRALRDPAPSDDVTVAVCDLNGNVVFARAVGRLWAPRRGLVQPGLRRLIATAVRGGGTASGRLVPGLVASSGNVQEELVADVALDWTGEYVFAVVRPVSRYNPPSWADLVVECASPACGETFTPAPSLVFCRVCDDYRCPHCGTCACAAEVSAQCPDCNCVLSVAERADPSSHECW